MRFFGRLFVIHATNFVSCLMFVMMHVTCSSLPCHVHASLRRDMLGAAYNVRHATAPRYERCLL